MDDTKTTRAADDIEQAIQFAINVGCDDVRAARVGVTKLAQLYGGVLSDATVATAMVVYAKRAATMRGVAP